MTGLDEMKTAILEESRKGAQRILEEASQKADAVLEAARRQAEAEAQEILLRAQEQKRLELQKAESGGELEERKTLLAEKTRILNETIAMALNKLRALPDKEYFDVIKRLAAANARAEKGELRFSKKDLDRLPAGFETEINRALPKEAGSVTVSKTPAGIADGFLMVYGDIEQNCSFEALVESGLDAIRDLLYHEIFS